MRSIGLGLALVAMMGGHATAQTALEKISVGKVSSDQDCKVYVLAESSSETHSTSATYGQSKTYAAADSDSGVYAHQGTYAHAGTYSNKETYREHIYKDCQDNFASLKMSVEAALASSGRFAVVPAKGSRYSVSVRISRLGTEESGFAQAGDRRSAGYVGAQKFITANLDFTLSEGGRIVGGGELTKRLEVGSVAGAGGAVQASEQDGAALYGEIQHQVAETVARAVAFKLQPLRVMSADGQNIELNYGAPLLKTGTMVEVVTPSGPIHFNVIGAGEGHSTARRDGSGDVSALTPGTIAQVIEPEDPAANGRRIQSVDLP